MALDIKDIEYLDKKFELLHSRVNNLGTEVWVAKSETCKRLTSLETKYTEHVKKEIDRVTVKWKLISILSTTAIGILGFLQGISYF